MTIIVFLVDTSASMNQRTYTGISLLDTTKGAVETFMKIRSRDPASRMDRYMLLTFEDPPANVKAGWKESHATFMNELKNLQAGSLSTLGPALKYTFDLLNVNRMQSGIDTYGQGRCPFYLEPAVIVCITDGRKLTTQNTVQQELNLPMNTAVPGSELTKEPFRWDQRLFSLVLRIPAVPPTDNPNTYIPPAEDSPIDAMCEVTGGRSYSVSSQWSLMQCLDSLVQKIQGGVVIQFEKIGPDPAPIAENNNGKINGIDQDQSTKENQDINRQDSVVLANGDEKKRSQTPTPSSTAWQSCRKLIYVQRSAQKGYFVGHWPIPEAFWPDPNSPSLPPRTAHPVVNFSCTPCDPLVVENLPFDKYELEPSPLTQYILERRQPNTAWQVFVSNSAKYSDIGHPFGYMKASTNLSSVNLFVMPYNYPVLLPLLGPVNSSPRGKKRATSRLQPLSASSWSYELFKVHKLKPTQKWRAQFESYLKTMPVYYAAPLRRALGRMGVHNLIPDQMDNCLSYSVVSYLKKLKNQAKNEYERLVASVGQKLPLAEPIKVTPRSQTSIIERPDFNQLVEHYGGNMAHLRHELNEYNSFTLALPDKDIHPQAFKNPFDIPRKQLLDQITRMRANFLTCLTGSGRRLQDEDQLHNVPVQQMGNYQEYLKKQPQALRELETAPVRQHMFGNPFKVNKNLMIDEADEAMPGQGVEKRRRTPRTTEDAQLMSPGPKKKRKPGPLPKDTPYRRPETPPPGITSPTPLSPLPTENHRFSDKLSETSESETESDILEINNVDYSPSPADTYTNHVEHNSESPGREEMMEEEGGVRYEPQGSLLHMNNEKNLAAAWEQNSRIRIQVVKEVKRPGKNHDLLFKHLSTIQGNLDTRCLFIRGIMREAARFKRKTLIQLLEQFEQSMVRAETRRVNNSVYNEKTPSR